MITIKKCYHIIFALCYFVFEGKSKSLGAYIRRGLYMAGLILGNLQ